MQIIIENASSNVTTDRDPALEHDARENHRAPVCKICLESIIPNYPVIADDSEQSAGIEVHGKAPGENKNPLSLNNA